jgi:methyl halide transferase
MPDRPESQIPSVSEPGFWKQAYDNGQDRWELGRAAPPLVRSVAELVGREKIERAIVLGCGRGHEARLLRRSGVEQVTAVDFVSTAIEQARMTDGDDGINATIDWRVQDVFDLSRSDRAGFDLVLEHTCFCAIDPARRSEWFDMVAAILRSGGVLLALFYAHGREGGPPFTTNRIEIEQAVLARTDFALESIEVPGDSIEKRAGQELLVRVRRR